MKKTSQDRLSAVKMALAINQFRSEQPNSEILNSEPIAVVGIGCRLPGGVSSSDGYWELLRNGKDAVVEVPEDRWSADRFYDANNRLAGKMNTRWGGFLENCDRFDSLFFGISPREAIAMDPQQRLLLEVTWEALWDAGLVPERMRASSTGVFVGIYGSDYAQISLGDPSTIGSHTCAGVSHSMASGRISFLLDLHGPSLSIDTACSSSLVALSVACQNLRGGGCRTAIAGGVSLKLRPEHYLCLSKLEMTSPEGRCRTFDASGDGFVPGEGCGIVILKSLTDALLEKCRVYAVIRGVAANQDGRTNSLTAPNGLAQQRVIQAAIANARIAPGDITYVETHGTGTALGDPIEVEALAETVGSARLSDQPCALGAVKTNLGHLESASGIAGFIKAVLALHHGEIPPNLHYHELNPHISLEGTRFFLPVQPTPWPRSERPRFAGVSSFGFSGTNVHLVLEEAPRLPARRAGSASEPLAGLLAISAHTAEACDEFAKRYHEYLEGAGRNLSLYDLCHSAAVRRNHYEERLAVVGESIEELRNRLEDFQAKRMKPGVFRGRVRHDAAGVVWVFSGQGSQWAGMGLQLYARYPVFRSAMDDCEGAIQRAAGWSVLQAIGAKNNGLRRTELAQPALFAVEVSLARLWESWGILPVAVLGHSVGEIAAAHVSGILPLETAARLVVLRGRLMERTAGLGKMAVLYQPAHDVAPEVDSFGGRLSIACINSPRATVVSGDPDAIDALVAQQNDRGNTSRPVRVEYAFHSAQMQECSAALERELGEVQRQSARVPMISTVTGRRVREADLDATYWARNVQQPVLFADAIGATAEMAAATFLEIGPHAVLLDSVAECLDGQADAPLLLGSMRRDANEPEAMLSALGKLYVHGAVVAWDKVYPEHAPPVTLPSYPYQRQRLWLDMQNRRSAEASCSLTMRLVRSPGLVKPACETEIDLHAMPWLADHRIGGDVLVPIAAFLEIARRALVAIGRSADSLNDFVILKSLVLDPHVARTVQVLFDQRKLEIYSFDGKEWTLHATAEVGMDPTLAPSTVTIPHEWTSSGADSLYESLDGLGANFGVAFRTVHAIKRGESEAWAWVRLGENEVLNAGDFLLHPALLDGCLQAIMAATPRRDLYVPFSIASFTVSGRCEGDVIAHARLLPGSTSESVAADVDVWREGELAVRLTDCRMRRADLNAQAANHVYVLRWREAARQKTLRIMGGRWLIISDDLACGEELAQLLLQKKCSAKVVGSGDVSQVEWSDLQGVVRLYGPDSGASPVAAMAGVEGLLALIQTILRETPEDPPQLCLVTRGAVDMSLRANTDALSEAAVLGMARTVALEHPELACVRIDGDTAADWLEAIATEIGQWDGEQEVALRGKSRYVPRLERSVPPESERKQWTIAEPGMIENLRFEMVARPAPGPSYVDVEVEAAALNFRDVLAVLGMYPGATPALGVEFCGRVARVGSEVKHLTRGDRVAGIAWGSFASSVCTPAALTFTVPDEISSVDAATLPNAFLTAHYCLCHIAQLRAGQRILIHAATGGVGLATIQLAQLAGAEIYATAGSERKREYLRHLGVQHIYSSRSLDFVAEILSATGGAGVDVVLNSLAGDYVNAGFSVVGTNGRFIEIGKNGIWTEGEARERRPDVLYSIVDLASIIDAEPEAIRGELATIQKLLTEGRIKPLPAHVFDFEDAPTAFRLMSQARHIGRVVLLQGSSLMVRPSRTYLITGGLGAIGISAAKWLAGLGARHLVLIGRGGANSAVQKTIEDLAETGIEVKVRAVDVTSREQLSRVLDEIQTSMPPLAGIMHAAGVVDDGMVENQTPERIRRVMAPKVLGAWNLAELTRESPLDFFFLCSSIAAVTGSPSQAGYSAANAWMDAFAHDRHRRGLAALSVNWGAWPEGGMASAVRTAGRRLSLAAMKTLRADEYWQALKEAVKLQTPQVTIARADWDNFQPMPAVLKDLARTSATPRSPQTTNESLKALIEKTPAQNRRAVFLNYARMLLRQYLALSSTQLIDEWEPLTRMGLDSLMAVELRNHLSAALERPLMATLLFDHPTLASLADYLVGNVKQKRDAMLDELQSLSDEEAEDLLKQELERP